MQDLSSGDDDDEDNDHDKSAEENELQARADMMAMLKATIKERQKNDQAQGEEQPADNMAHLAGQHIFTGSLDDQKVFRRTRSASEKTDIANSIMNGAAEERQEFREGSIAESEEDDRIMLVPEFEEDSDHGKVFFIPFESDSGETDLPQRPAEQVQHFIECALRANQDNNQTKENDNIETRVKDGEATSSSSSEIANTVPVATTQESKPPAQGSFPDQQPNAQDSSRNKQDNAQLGERSHKETEEHIPTPADTPKVTEESQKRGNDVSRERQARDKGKDKLTHDFDTKESGRKVLRTATPTPQGTARSWVWDRDTTENRSVSPDSPRLAGSSSGAERTRSPRGGATKRSPLLVPEEPPSLRASTCLFCTLS